MRSDFSLNSLQYTNNIKLTLITMQGHQKQIYKIYMYNIIGLRDQDYSNKIIAGIKFIVVIMMKYTYKS